MVNFQDIFGNFVFLALFILAGTAFIIVVQSDNEATQPVLEDPLFNQSYVDLQNTLSGLESTSKTQYGQFTEETPEPGALSIVLFGIVAAGKTFSNVVLATFTVLIALPLHVLGLPDTLFAALASWLVIVLVVAGWILYKVGG